MQQTEHSARVPTAEFDEYADGYAAGMENPLKRFAGDSADQFIDVKVDWLLRDLVRNPIPGNGQQAALTLLDYGCGVGAFIKSLQRHHFSGAIHGCDISEAMLDEARRAWGDGPLPALDLVTNNRIPHPDGTFDVIITCAVLHHIPIDQRCDVFREQVRVLKPHGRLYVFEHNPFNLVTQWVVRHTAIDRNAILLTPSEPRAAMRNLFLGRIRTNHLLFFPPRWQWTRQLERWLAWFPLGGQYVVTGTKTEGAQ
jgi:ubiquinone/menaquinone biosynthesis C-methylase UbiE